jgi:hypothetical protein
MMVRQWGGLDMGGISVARSGCTDVDGEDAMARQGRCLAWQTMGWALVLEAPGRLAAAVGNGAYGWGSCA